MSVADTILKSNKEMQDKKPKEKEITEKDMLRAAKEAGLLNNTPEPKKKRGRPIGSKSPSRKKELGTQEAIGNIQKALYIKKLRGYRKLFPVELAETLDRYDALSKSPEELKAMCDACRTAVEDDMEIEFYPKAINETMGKIDHGIGTLLHMFPDLPYAKYLHYFIGIGKVLQQDESVQKDIKLITIDLLGTLPSNPYARILSKLFWNGKDVFVSNFATQTICSDENNLREFDDL